MNEEIRKINSNTFEIWRKAVVIDKKKLEKDLEKIKKGIEKAESEEQLNELRATEAEIEDLLSKIEGL